MHQVNTSTIGMRPVERGGGALAILAAGNWDLWSSYPRIIKWHFPNAAPQTFC